MTQETAFDPDFNPELPDEEPASNVTNLPPGSAADAIRRAEGRQITASVEALLKDLTSPNQDASLQTSQLIQITTQIIPLLLREATADLPNESRSIAASRSLTAIRDTMNMVVKRHELITNDSFDIRSPRAQAVFGWLIDLFQEVLLTILNPEDVNRIFNELAGRLGAWEDKVEKQLKGVSTKMIPHLESPFSSQFKAQVRDLDPSTED